MHILVLNRGSSSLKCSLYQFDALPADPLEPIWQAHLEWKNQYEKAHLLIQRGRDKVDQKLEAVNSKELLEKTISFLSNGELAPLESPDEVDVVGHRIVHGGKKYNQTTKIDRQVKDQIRKLADLAPLHNMEDLEGIEVLEKLFPKAPQFAVFDTAFHHTLPQRAVVYPGPHHWIDEGIVRYGFHGTSFQYCSKRAAQLLQCDGKKLKMIICHLGSGASLCAVKEGKSIDTTMGFTPLEGLMMDTRSGTIDPGIVLYLAKKMSAEEISNLLYKKSGLLGLSEKSSDMRDILEQKTEKDKLALDVYLHRLTTLIGSLNVSLGGMDTLIFTAGIGENAPEIRKKVCEALQFFGMELDEGKNQKNAEGVISKDSSKIKILKICTEEAFEIARECWQQLR